jgi:hypothetical protein
MDKTVFPSFCIVVETDNLAIVDLDELFRCLQSIESQGDLVRLADGVFVADGGVVPEAVLTEMNRRYPWVTILKRAHGASYIDLKLAGSLETESEIVVFCDGDVVYEAGWLEALLDGFCQRPDADMIAGETTTPITGPYSLAFALTFNFPLPDPAELYRGQNLIHMARVLRESGVILRQPRAHGWHAVVPPSEVIARYYRLGSDAASIRAITARETGRPYLGAMAPDRPGHGVLGRLADRLRQIARTQPSSLLLLPLALPVLCVMGTAYLVGRAWAGLWQSRELRDASARAA